MPEAETTSAKILSSNDRVVIELSENGVAHVRFVRTDKMNALDPAMFDAMIEAAQSLNATKGVRVVVLSGDGRAFCAGIDLSNFTNPSGDTSRSLETRTHGNTNKYQEVAYQWRRLGVPVIAAVHGVCFGGGLQIASGADIRIVHPETRMAVMEMKWGLVPDMAGYALWRGLVRDDVLRELVYTNREFSGAEAQSLGFATYVEDEPLAKAMEMAEVIAGKNPDAIRASKRLHAAMHDNSTDDILMMESVEQDKISRTKNQIEAVMSSMQKRAGVFDDVEVA
ncbi:crotonase/enoyl-CoA hydratase family protein [Erythrobacter sp. SCSIO 43205]|uniref:crotonase/enoyl-CoA hydratase family protein n=1 Tax=Erythrobacter sp. SCSIO 43205 TaxID=2779361 RepID=UPI001CA9089B|nr:crotonase/enoyl-CoA hydratase family protein [Erythrobacter sp. SCSIO 43205]UAB78103.1 crotonase/enoyl-CoA hydratase family protein [Erythrobacter sp. SCSIO 43205]